MLLITLIFLLFLLFPFLPSIKEYLNPRDILPLPIDFNYSRNPRYFSESFKRKLHEAIKIEDVLKALDGTGILDFHGEDIKIYHIDSIPSEMELNKIIYMLGDLKTGENVTIKGNVFSQGKVVLENNSEIGEKGKIKSAVGKKGIHIKGKVKVYGYMMTEGEGKVN